VDAGLPRPGGRGVARGHQEAEDLNHRAGTIYALVWEWARYLYRGEWKTVEEWIPPHHRRPATTFALTPCHSIAIGWQGVLRSGRAKRHRGTETIADRSCEAACGRLWGGGTVAYSVENSQKAS